MAVFQLTQLYGEHKPTVDLDKFKMLLILISTLIILCVKLLILPVWIPIVHACTCTFICVYVVYQVYELMLNL